MKIETGKLVQYCLSYVYTLSCLWPQYTSTNIITLDEKNPGRQSIQHQPNKCGTKACHCWWCHLFLFAVQGPLKISARSVSLQAYPKSSWTMETTVLSMELRGHGGKMELTNGNKTWQKSTSKNTQTCHTNKIHSQELGKTKTKKNTSWTKLLVQFKLLCFLMKARPL